MASPIKLSPQDEQEMREGMALYEMTQSAGFAVLRKWLEDRAYHTWADPRETNNPQEWQWRELNTFYASNNAKELLESIAAAVNRSEYLQKVQAGEITTGRMKI